MRDRVKLQSWLVRTAVVLLLLASSVHGLSRVSITEDGGYANIVIKIRKEVSEDDCPDILRGIKVMIQIEYFETCYKISQHALCSYNLCHPHSLYIVKKADMSLTKLSLGGNNSITPAQRIPITLFYSAP
jgi:hypothetical protein